MIHYKEIETKHHTITFYADMYQLPREGVDLFPQIKLGWNGGFTIQFDWLWFCGGVEIRKDLII